MSGDKAIEECCRSQLLTLFATTGGTMERKLIVLWRELHVPVHAHPRPYL